MLELLKLLNIIRQLNISIKGIVILNVISGILEIGSIYALYYVIKIIINDSSSNIFHIEINNYLKISAVIVLIIFLVKNIINYLIYNYSLNITKNIHQKLKNNVLSNILSLPLIKIENYSTSKLIKIVLDEIDTIINTGIIQLIILIGELITLILIVSFLIFENPKFFFILILFILFIYSIAFLLKIKLINISKEIQYNAFELSSQLKEIIQNSLYIILYNKNKFFINKFNKISNKLIIELNKSQKFGSLHKYFLEMIIISLITLLILSNDKSELLPILTIYGMAAFRLAPSVNRIIASVNSFKLASSSIAVIEKLDSEIINFENNKVIHHGNISKIHFNKIKSDFFKNKEITFTANKGDVIIFSGRSGSGKSSLMKIISGLMMPNGGSSFINDVKLKTFMELRGVVAFLGQDYKLIKGSILDNIAFGVDPEFVDYKIVNNIIEVLEIKNIVSPNLGGLNRIVKEDGDGLSGGEKQRIAIARTLYSGRGVIVFDEPTSSLDDNSKTILIKIIEKLRKSKIILIASHDNIFINEQSFKKYSLS